MELYFEHTLKCLEWDLSKLEGICNGIKPDNYERDGISVAAYTCLYGYLTVNEKYSHDLMKCCVQTLYPAYSFPTEYRFEHLSNIQKSILKKLGQCADNKISFTLLLDSFISLPVSNCDELGPFCTELNITKNVFNNVSSNSDIPLCHCDKIVSNGVLIELFNQWQLSGKTYDQAENCFKSLFGNHGQNAKHCVYFWRKKFSKYQKLRRMKVKCSVFLQENCGFISSPTPFSPPTNIASSSTINAHNSRIVNSQNITSIVGSAGSVANLNVNNPNNNYSSLFVSSHTQNDSHSKIKSLSNELCHLTSDLNNQTKMCSRKDRMIHSLKQQLQMKNKSHSVLQSDTKHLQERYNQMNDMFNTLKKQTSSNNIKNLKRRIKRKDESITKHLSTISLLNISLASARHGTNNQSEQYNTLSQQVSDLKHDKKSLQTSISGYNQKSIASEQYLLQLQCELEELNNNYRKLLGEKDDLEFQLKDLRSQTLKSKDGMKYTTDMRKTCIELQTRAQVSAEQVSNVLEIVSKNLFHREIEDLPTRQTASSMVDEGHILAKCQVAEVLKECTHFDLHTDSTTRDGKRYLNISLTPSNNEQLSLGFGEIAQEDAQTLVEYDISTLSEVAKIFSECNDDEPTEQNEFLVNTVKKMTAMMSDRAANEKLHHKKFKEWAQNFVNENDKSEDKEVTLIFLYCLSHVLLGFHSESMKALKAFETPYFPLGRDKLPQFRNNSEPATITAIRTVGLAFGPRGDQKSGCREDWLAYCLGENIKSKITSYRSNRFNCTFEGAVSVFHHREHIVAFLGGGFKQLNGLLQSVLSDFEDNVIICALRALGLMHYHISGPFWRLTISSEHHMKLGDSLTELRNRLVDLGKDSSHLLHENMLPVLPKFPPLKSDTSDSLFCNVEPAQQDFTLEVLRELCKAFITIIESQLATYLPGGELFSPSEELTGKMKHTKLNNLVCENSFGDIDYTQKRKPHATTHTHSSIQMLKRNKTMDWLANKPEKRQTELWNSVRKLKNKYKAEHLENNINVRKRKLEVMKEKSRKTEQSKIDKDQKRESILTHAQSYGGPFLVNVKDQIFHILQKQNSMTQMSKILKNELNYHKIVLLKKHSLLKSSGLSLKIMLNNFIQYLDPNHTTLLDVPPCKVRSPKLKVCRNTTKLPVKKRRLNESSSESSSSDSEFYDSDPEDVYDSQQEDPIQINCNLTCGTLVAVAYDDKFYIGEIKQCLPLDVFDIKFLSQKARGNNAFTFNSLSRPEKVERKYIFFAPISIIPIANGRQSKVEDISKVEHYYKLYFENFFLT